MNRPGPSILLSSGLSLSPRPESNRQLSLWSLIALYKIDGSLSGSGRLPSLSFEPFRPKVGYRKDGIKSSKVKLLGICWVVAAVDKEVLVLYSLRLGLVTQFTQKIVHNCCTYF